MRSRKPTLTPRTLAQYFEAPEEHLGCFGWACGYSADAGFLNDAAERFTRQTEGQRASMGTAVLALMLDPGEPAISFVDVPGAAHLPLRTLAEKPFALLHAKVALLGFRHQSDPARWIVRLVVSTGNWTRLTMEQSLDLAWCIDVHSDELQAADQDTCLRCADITAAQSLLRWLAGLFDTRILQAGTGDHPGETANAISRLDRWLSLCEAQAGDAAPRFFDSRARSLLAQLPGKIRDAGAGVARNWLSMGSGYYETASVPGAVPTVLTKIVGALQAEKLLTAAPGLDVFVNPESCQAVAQSADALAQAGYTVRAAGQSAEIFSDGESRNLHAKFLFSANFREGSNNCSSAWIYLGSGNLTNPGFVTAMAPGGGNLEAGVVFAPPQLLWEQQGDSAPERVVSNLLPIQWETKYEEGTVLVAGADMPDRPDQYIAPPVAWLLWHEAGQAGGILSPAQGTAGFDVLDPAGAPCVPDTAGFLWPDTQPRQVTVRWTGNGEARTAVVPVVDAFGRIAPTTLAALDLDQAWWQLASFPLPPDDEDASAGDGQEGGNARRQTHAGARSHAGSYPVRRMMELVEQLAASQTRIDASDWATWCCRLKQTLMLAADSHAVQAFRDLGLNPLSPLRAAPFRPDFAESGNTPAGRLYESVLSQIEQAWNVEGLTAIGAQP
ncbi:hypothetical protein [Cupriavidus basilensis]|uniref:hypothetical protein n=1 Tax=Cupriavidus basilensis TaxID=68895 RepID=UPI0023E7A15B|nr:hypothetical protein [Cupriavidus basilensis]MDF3886281.1 hypothetical protein [Cupriavidus basilensis]